MKETTQELKKKLAELDASREAIMREIEQSDDHVSYDEIYSFLECGEWTEAIYDILLHGELVKEFRVNVIDIAIDWDDVNNRLMLCDWNYKMEYEGDNPIIEYMSADVLDGTFDSDEDFVNIIGADGPRNDIAELQKLLIETTEKIKNKFPNADPLDIVIAAQDLLPHL